MLVFIQLKFGLLELLLKLEHLCLDLLQLGLLLFLGLLLLRLRLLALQ